jgi:TonB family protein
VPISNSQLINRLLCPVVVLGTFLTMLPPALTADTTNTEVNTQTSYPSSYDSKILDSLSAFPDSMFTVPYSGYFQRFSLGDPLNNPAIAGTPAPCGPSNKVAFVWLRVKLGDADTVTEYQVMYCSAPNCSYEDLAVASTKHASLLRPKGTVAAGQWLWHQVTFFREGPAVACDAAGLPSPDEFIPVEIHPEKIYSPEPGTISRKLNFECSVIVQLLIDSSGAVPMAIIARTSGFPDLDNEAMLVAMRSKFKPAIQDGHVIPTWAYSKVDFPKN